MKIIFLDIDGVLNSHRSMLAKVGPSPKPPVSGGPFTSNQLDVEIFGRRQAASIDPVAVQLLNRVIKATGAKLVISSTHRFIAKSAGGFDNDLLRQYIKHFGINGEVIGATPILNDVPRGEEIQAWLNSSQIPVEGFIIIDDDDDMLESQLPFFVKTDARVALTVENVEAAVQLLGESTKKLWED